MKSFVFRLQKVLDYRMGVEDEKKQAFIKARLDYLREKDILDYLHEKLEGCYNDVTEKESSIFAYIAKYNYMTFLEEKKEDQVKKVQVYEEEMNKKKYEFTESQRDRKVIDKLKENALMEYRTSLDRLEQKQNDEFALYGYMRK